MTPYKKLNKETDANVGIELKTLDGKIHKLSIVKDSRGYEYFCFVCEANIYHEIYSGGKTGCGTSYKSELSYKPYTFVRFISELDIE